MVLEFLHGATAHTVGGNYMSKLKRPTLTTTKNCIMLLKEALADCKGLWKDYRNAHAIENLQMVLTMLTDDKRWMEK